MLYRYLLLNGRYLYTGLFGNTSALATHIQPSTLNPQPSTLNPQPSTLNPQPSTLNLQLSTFNLQPSTFNLQPSTFNPLCGVLCAVVLCCAVLCCAVLCCAVLCCVVLCCVVLCCAVLLQVPSRRGCFFCSRPSLRSSRCSTKLWCMFTQTTHRHRDTSFTAHSLVSHYTFTCLDVMLM